MSSLGKIIDQCSKLWSFWLPRQDEKKIGEYNFREILCKENSNEVLLITRVGKKDKSTTFTATKQENSLLNIWPTLLMGWISTPQTFQVQDGSARQCLPLQLWENTLLVPLFPVGNRRVRKKYSAHLTITSFPMTPVSP